MSKAETRPGPKSVETETLQKWSSVRQHHIWPGDVRLTARSAPTLQPTSITFTQIAQRGSSVRYAPPPCDARLWVWRLMTWNHPFIMSGTYFVPDSPHQHAVFWMRANAHWICTEMIEIWALKYMKASFFGPLNGYGVLDTVYSFIMFFILPIFMN